MLPDDTPVAKLREYATKDNVSFGENDMDIMENEWDKAELQDWGIEFAPEKEKDEFKDRFNAISDDNALYPLIPKYDEKHELFIIISGNEVDSNWLRERLDMQHMKSYKTGKISKSNVIDIKMYAMPCKIVIPSHKRHDRVFAKKLVNDPIVCVAESQADLYREFNPDCEIVTHPDDIIGLIPKRNWMARYFGELFMLDDDVHACKTLYAEKGESGRVKDKDKITRIILSLHEMASLMDIHLSASPHGYHL